MAEIFWRFRLCAWIVASSIILLIGKSIQRIPNKGITLFYSLLPEDVAAFPLDYTFSDFKLYKWERCNLTDPGQKKHLEIINDQFGMKHIVIRRGDEITRGFNLEVHCFWKANSFTGGFEVRITFIIQYSGYYESNILIDTSEYVIPFQKYSTTTRSKRLMCNDMSINVNLESSESDKHLEKFLRVKVFSFTGDSEKITIPMKFKSRSNELFIFGDYIVVSYIMNDYQTQTWVKVLQLYKAQLKDELGDRAERESVLTKQIDGTVLQLFEGMICTYISIPIITDHFLLQVTNFRMNTTKFYLVSSNSFNLKKSQEINVALENCRIRDFVSPRYQKFYLYCLPRSRTSMHALELTIRPFYLKTINRVGSQIFDITTLKRNLKDFDLNYTDIKILNVAFSFLNDKEVPSFFLVIKTSALEYSHIVSFSLNSDKIILMGLSDNQYEMFEVVEGINFYFVNNFGLFSIKSSHLERVHYFKNLETGIYFFRHFCFEGPAVCLIVKRHNQFDMIVTVHLISENQFPLQRVYFNKTYSFDQPVDDVMVFRISPNLLNVVFSYKVSIKTSKVDNAWRLVYQNISIDYPGFTYSLQTSEKIRDYLNLKFTINKESSGSIKLKDPESESLSVMYFNDSRNLIEPETVCELNQLFSFQGPISSVRIGEDTNPDVTLQKVLNLTQSFVLEDSDCWVMQRMENGTFACLSRNYEVTLWDKESRILTSDIKELGDSKGFLSKICYESETQFIVIEKDLLLFFVCKVLEIETQEENAARIV